MIKHIVQSDYLHRLSNRQFSALIALPFDDIRTLWVIGILSSAGLRPVAQPDGAWIGAVALNDALLDNVFRPAVPPAMLTHLQELYTEFYDPKAPVKNSDEEADSDPAMEPIMPPPRPAKPKLPPRREGPGIEMGS